MDIDTITDTPIVSIIMPLYNKKNYVKRAIDSIQQQTVDNWELIIIDDGSTDGSTKEVPNDDERINVYRQKNLGPAAARNAGISKAQGRLVTFIDADDYYYPNKLEQEIALLDNNENIDWMISARNYEVKNEVSVRKISVNGQAISKPSAVITDALLQLTPSEWHINGLCIKQNLLTRLSGFREDMRCYEVTDYFYRCALIQPKVIVYSLPLHCQVDVPMSTFKEPYHRIQGLRLLAENIQKLPQAYPAYSDLLRKVSREMTLDYCAKLILFGFKIDSRRYLLGHFEYKRNLRWWKILLASWLPDIIIKQILADKYPFKQN